MKVDSLYGVGMMGGQIQAILIDSTQLAEKARAVHGLSGEVAAALGRHLTASAILGAMIPFEEPMTVFLDGAEKQWRLAAVAYPDGRVKGYAEGLRGRMSADGRMPSDGHLTVSKHLQDGRRFQREADVRPDALEAGYAAILGAHGAGPFHLAVGAVAGERVTSAAGLLLWLGADASDEAAEALCRLLPAVRDIAGLMKDINLDEAVTRLFAPLAPEVTGAVYTRFSCGCNRADFEKALLAAGETGLAKLMENPDGADARCSYCGRIWHFSGEQLGQLITRVRRP